MIVVLLISLHLQVLKHMLYPNVPAMFTGTMMVLKGIYTSRLLQWLFWQWMGGGGGWIYRNWLVLPKFFSSSYEKFWLVLFIFDIIIMSLDCWFFKVHLDHFISLFLRQSSSLGYNTYLKFKYLLNWILCINCWNLVWAFFFYCLLLDQ